MSLNIAKRLGGKIETHPTLLRTAAVPELLAEINAETKKLANNGSLELEGNLEIMSHIPLVLLIPTPIPTHTTVFLPEQTMTQGN